MTWVIIIEIWYEDVSSGMSLPSGTLSLAPSEFREMCFEMTSQDELRYEFQSDRPIDFDIH